MIFLHERGKARINIIELYSFILGLSDNIWIFFIKITSTMDKFIIE